MIKKNYSVIVTVFNEEKTIVPLLNSFIKQTVQLNELVIVDGGSQDKTYQLIQKFQKKNPKFPLKLFLRKGNRSIGRNFAIHKTKSSFVAITDAGCIPQKNWLEELIKKQIETKAEVIAGYYYGISTKTFEEAVIPYALVMPDKIDEKSFLPATRSMMISKKVWKKIGGFDENMSDNEDYIFARNLKKQKIKIIFAKKALAGWQPRSDLNSFLVMIYRFAKGDVTAGIWRPKVFLIFLRYLLWFLGLFIALTNHPIMCEIVGIGNKYRYFKCLTFLLKSISELLLVGLVFSLFIYILWAIKKNYRYAKKGWYWLPVLQVSSDFAVMAGSLVGLKNRFYNINSDR